MKLTDNFMGLIGKMDVVTFAGVAKLLGVKTVELNQETNEAEPRSFVDVFEDVVRVFDSKDRNFKRQLIKIIKKANACKDD